MSTFAPRPDKSPLSLRVLVTQVVTYTPASVVPAGMGLLSSAVFTRLLSAAGYGQYSLAMSAATLVTAIAVQWVQQGVNRYLPAATQAQEQLCLKQALFTALVIVESAVVLMGAVALAVVREYAYTLPAVALVGLNAVYGPTVIVFQAEMQGRRYSFFHALNAVLKFLFGLTLIVVLGPHPALMIWGSVLGLAVLLPSIWRQAGVPGVPRMSWLKDPCVRKVLRKFVGYGLPMTGWFMASNLMSVSDRYVIQFFRGPAEVGIYSANYHLISGAIGIVTAPVLLAAHPFLVRAWGEGDGEKTRRWLGRAIELLSVLGTVAVAVTALLSADLARGFLGSEFRAGHNVMPLVLAGIVVWNVSMYLHKPLEFLEETKTMFAFALAAAIVNVVLNVAFVPKYGYIAAAWTTLFSYAMYAVGVGLAGWRRLRWHVRGSLLVSVLLWAVAMVYTGTWLRRFGISWGGHLGGLVGELVSLAAFALGLLVIAWHRVKSAIERARRA